jgi:hypothetical protein
MKWLCRIHPKSGSMPTIPVSLFLYLRRSIRREGSEFDVHGHVLKLNFAKGRAHFNKDRNPHYGTSLPGHPPEELIDSFLQAAGRARGLAKPFRGAFEMTDILVILDENGQKAFDFGGVMIPEKGVSYSFCVSVEMQGTAVKLSLLNVVALPNIKTRKQADQYTIENMITGSFRHKANKITILECGPYSHAKMAGLLLMMAAQAKANRPLPVPSAFRRVIGELTQKFITPVRNWLDKPWGKSPAPGEPKV